MDVGADPVRARSLVAVVPQRNNLDRSLSIRQDLLFHAAYHGVPAAERARRADALLEEFGLADRAGDKPDMFSGGQAQRVMVARALMHAPRCCSWTSRPPGWTAARLFVWDRVRDLKARGVTIVLTTHDMDEAAELADRVGIMDHGRLLALDTPAALTRGLPGRTTLEVAVTLDGTPAEALLAELGALDGVERVEQVAARGRCGPAVPGREAPLLVAPVASVVAGHRAQLTDVAIGTPSLEDVFIALTGRALR